MTRRRAAVCAPSGARSPAGSSTTSKRTSRAGRSSTRRIPPRAYHNPNGYQRPDEWDFVTYFECADEHLPVFEKICGALRDVRQNPEWRYVVEGEEWRGVRVVRW